MSEVSDHIERVAIDDLMPDPDNARRHPDENIAAIAASLDQFEQPQALVVRRSDGRVIAGNGRLQAMRQLGWTHAQVRYVDWDDATCRAFALADNRTAELALWDTEVLGRHIDALRVDYDVSDLGFTEAALTDLLGDERGDHGEVDEDEVPPVPVEPVSRLGDLWTVGRHRVLCGNSCDAADVARVLDGALADAVLTDPPYGISYTGKTKARLKIENDDAAGLRKLLTAALGVARTHSRPGAAWYVAGPTGPAMIDFCQVLTDLDVWRQTLVWVKDSFVLGRSDYHYRHEVIFYGWTPGGDRVVPQDRKQDSVWECPRPRQSQEHPTMKPVALYARMVEHSTRPGDLVYEPFGGSGTTLVAAEQMGRRGCAIELEPTYVDVIVRRLEQVTGAKATRVSAPTEASCAQS